jgi:hypothetical protein
MAAAALAGCGGGGTNPSSGAAAGVTATLARYYDASRRADPRALMATLAPDYRYNGLDAATFANAFDIPFGLTYRALNERIAAVTTVGDTATAAVDTNFQGHLNLEFRRFGRPAVNGTSRQVIELERRGTEWLITAFRPVRTHFANPDTIAPTLTEFTANGATSLRLAPGEPVTLTGKTTYSFHLIALLGASSEEANPDFDVAVPVTLHVTAPAAPGRFLATVFAYTEVPNPETGSLVFLAGDLVTIPVTVAAP